MRLNNCIHPKLIILFIFVTDTRCFVLQIKVAFFSIVMKLFNIHNLIPICKTLKIAQNVFYRRLIGIILQRNNIITPYILQSVEKVAISISASEKRPVDVFVRVVHQSVLVHTHGGAVSCRFSGPRPDPHLSTLTFDQQGRAINYISLRFCTHAVRNLLGIFSLVGISGRYTNTFYSLVMILIRYSSYNRPQNTAQVNNTLQTLVSQKLR